MKINEIKQVPDSKIGKLNKNKVVPKPNEEFTLNYLLLFGFNIELIRPTSTQKVKNPDVLIMGTIWEIKTPTSSSKNTIKNRFREASNQAAKVIFDLRKVKKDADKVEKQLLELFRGNGTVRRMMIIQKSGTLLDFIK